MSKLNSLAFWMLMVLLVACGGKATEEDIPPVDQLPRIGQSQPAPRCLAKVYHQDDLGPANQTAVIPTDGGWFVATSAAKPDRDQSVLLHRFDDGSLSGASSRSAVNAGLGQLTLSGDSTALLLSGYGHKEGERPKPMVEVVSLDSGKRLSLEGWQPGAIARDPVATRGYVYAGTHTRGDSGMWAQLGSIEPDGVQTANSDTPLLGAQCAFSGGVAANLSGDIAAMMVTGDLVSRQYNILFLVYSRQFGRWSRTTLGSYPAPELASGQCHPESVFRPFGVFADGTDAWVAWHAIWADSQGVHLADIDSQTMRRREVQIGLPAGTAAALSIAQVPNGYLLALSGAPTERVAESIGVVFVRPSGEVAAYQTLTYGQMLAEPVGGDPYQASTAAIAASADGHSAALAYVTKGGQAKVRFFSNDCQ